MVALFADVLDNFEESKHFKALDGTIETLPAWRLWNEEVVSVYRGRGLALDIARRVAIATDAVKALQTEIVKCPSVAREIILNPDMLYGLSQAIALDDEMCRREACEVVILFAQECGSRAGDAVVGCPKLLNIMCSKALQTEEAHVLDALTALSHQNSKMLWIVTTIIKVMRIEKKCDAGLLRRTLKAWRFETHADDSKTAAIEALLEALAKGNEHPTNEQVGEDCELISTKHKTFAPAEKMCDVSEWIPPEEKMCDVDYYLTKEKMCDVDNYLNVYNRGIIMDPATKHKANRSAVPGALRLPKIRDDVTNSQRLPLQSSSVSIGSEISSHLYSTWTGIGLVSEDECNSASASSTLSLPSTTGTRTTFSSVVMNKETKHEAVNPEPATITARLLQRSQQLSCDIDNLRSTRELPEARILPERQWTPDKKETMCDVSDLIYTKGEEPKVSVWDSYKNYHTLTAPPDSLLFASSHAAPALYSSWNPQSNAQTAMTGPYSRRDENGNPMAVHHLDHEHIARLRSQAIRPAPKHYGRSPSAPTRMSEPESLSSGLYGSQNCKYAVIGQPVAKLISPASTSKPRAMLPPPRVLPMIDDPPTSNDQHGERSNAKSAPTSTHGEMLLPPRVLEMIDDPQTSNVQHGERSNAKTWGAATIQVPLRKAAPASPGTSELFSYFGRSLNSSGDGTATVQVATLPGAGYVTMRQSAPVLPPPEMRSTSHLRTTSPIPPHRATSERTLGDSTFHKAADEFAFQRVGVAAMMVRKGQSPVASRDDSPRRSVSPLRSSLPDAPASTTVMRSGVGADTIQFATLPGASGYVNMRQSAPVLPNPNTFVFTNSMRSSFDQAGLQQQNAGMWRSVDQPGTAPMQMMTTPLQMMTQHTPVRDASLSEVLSIMDDMKQPASMGYTPQAAASDWVGADLGAAEQEQRQTRGELAQQRPEQRPEQERQRPEQERQRLEQERQRQRQRSSPSPARQRASRSPARRTQGSASRADVASMADEASRRDMLLSTGDAYAIHQTVSIDPISADLLGPRLGPRLSLPTAATRAQEYECQRDAQRRAVSPMDRSRSPCRSFSPFRQDDADDDDWC